MTLGTFIYYANYEKYLRMTEVIEALFEALPMAIISYLNNELDLD